MRTSITFRKAFTFIMTFSVYCYSRYYFIFIVATFYIGIQIVTKYNRSRKRPHERDKNQKQLILEGNLLFPYT